MTSFKTAALMALAILTVGCSSARAEIVIAVASSMSGPEAAGGEQFRRGAEKAVADINAKGGLLGQKVQLLVEDDACDPKQARNVAEDVVSKKGVFVAGHFCSSSSIPASEVYEEAGVIQISPGSTNPKLTERGYTNIFRVCGRDDAQGPTSAAYVTSAMKGKSVAVVHDKSAYGKGLADEFLKAFNKLGGKEVLYEAITPGEKDYGALVSKLKNAKADIIFYGGYKTEAGLIVRQSVEQGLKAIVIGGDALAFSEYWAITGPAGEGTMMTFSPDPRKIPGNADLVKWFRDQKFEPETYTLYTYATVQAWALAVQKAGSTDASKVAAALRANKFDTALGSIGFDAKGDVIGPGYVMYRWKDGTYATIQ